MVHGQVSQEEVFDQKALLELVDNDEDFFKDLIETFIADVETLQSDLKSALLEREYENIKIISHTLKGSSASVMCQPLSGASASVEGYIKLKQELDEEIEQSVVEQKVGQVISEITKVLQELLQELQE